MADEERDAKVSGRYRELGAEEPPPQIDAAILAASRRAVELHPAPLVAPTGRRRWYFPMAAVAIIVLAVAVTIHIERQQPDPETPLPSPAAPIPPAVSVPPPQPEARKAEAPRSAQQARPARPKFAEDPGATSKEAQSRRAERPVEQPLEASVQSAPVPSAAPSTSADTAGAAAKPVPAARVGAQGLREQPPVDSRQVWLERIAELRRQGKDDEADKSLADFRKRYPDYRIPRAMLEKVEKR